MEFGSINRLGSGEVAEIEGGFVFAWHMFGGSASVAVQEAADLVGCVLGIDGKRYAGRSGRDTNGESYVGQRQRESET